MHKNVLEIFEYELRQQCRLIILGARMLNAHVQALTEALGRRQTNLQAADDGIWFALQGMLISSANASKILWGSKSEGDLATRQPLREAVEIDEKSPLYSRQLRNDFEHFDERLEDWHGRSAQRNFFGRSIGQTDFIVVPPGHEQPPLFGHYDPENGAVVFWDRSVLVQPLVTEAERVIRVIDGNGERRWPRP